MADMRGLELKVHQRARVAGDAAAQAVARQISANAPRDSGALAAGVKVHRETGPTEERWTISTDARSADGFPYDVAQEEGTGVYIGRGRIYPVRAKALTFYWKKAGRVVSFKSVKGTPPTRFFQRGVRDWVTRLREAFTAVR